MHTVVIYNKVWSKDKLAQLSCELNQIMILRENISLARRLCTGCDSEFQQTVQKIDQLEESVRITYHALQNYIKSVENADKILIAEMSDQNNQRSFFD